MENVYFSSILSRVIISIILNFSLN
ncbi:hypothetical protein CY0110_17437 [Crocosphaera chwakensis CCY0110]|uniref:Uncharacterized protein n=1 Tax=Crocosphaera chwakensis CCY0110 TaxID=391612 RepID=A3IIG9_9CHRO|nr:hypothetical protein CY0110_17437 [Crocosphaera chwakensis CCY0110]